MNPAERTVDLQGKRVLVFIVAYNAETTIEKVLSRIPASLHTPDVEVLIIDDSSKDKTFQNGLRFQQQTAAFKITILRTPRNQGYGGNQKLGYRYAIDNGFDIVALVHGDGQYAPEKLPALLEPLVRGEADAVFGSRMIDKQAARAGGMPAYKWLGNQVLTHFQNAMLGTALSEFHSGYRLYSTAALAQAKLERAMLYEADLSAADLSGANLTEAKMQKARLVRARLDGAHMPEAILTGARLDEASLRGANLSAANLVEVTLRRANLEGANLNNAGLVDAVLREANLKGANLSEADLFGADLSGANLTGADLSEARLSRAILTGAVLDGANLKGALMPDGSVHP
jgi:uncharacterized protein YjbI with pentapeptide repeats